jgi:glycine betaine/choline ABC-type transport system substrate-binding protein
MSILILHVLTTNQKSATVDVDPSLILDGAETAIRSSVLSHIDLCAQYTGTDIFLLKPRSADTDANEVSIANGVDSGLDQRYRVNIFGDTESVEHAKTRTLMMIDQIVCRSKTCK